MRVRTLLNHCHPIKSFVYPDKWCNRAMRSRPEPIKKFVKTLRARQPLIMNWFKAKKVYSSGVVEGLPARGGINPQILRMRL